MDIHSISNFCLKHAYLIFCTASTSPKLRTDGMTPLELLVIDEAAQLKECESAIPLQLPGIRHAILIGDEQQLPAMVFSKISEEAEFGRSLFERLVSLGHKKHLLNTQYRMHPSISLFPNTEFYRKQILDAPKVKESSHKRDFLQGNMYGAYSFINVAYGTEGHGHGKKNIVEVAVVSEIVESLFKASVASRQKLSVGVISPYNAQVFAIKERLGGTYDTQNDFSVSVRTVDGFQGGEEDVIIISTVRSNGKGSVGFLDKLQRTNVALTRARYCLWVLGNGPTLIDSGSIWRKLVLDAKNRGCFFDADKDKSLMEAIIAGLVELGEFDKLLGLDSLLFDGARWKVRFTNDFWNSMGKIRKIDTQKEVIALFMKLASGWRHLQKQEVLYLMDGISSELLEVYNIDGLFNLVWTVDILSENHKYIQVLKVWDILPLEEIPKLAKRLDVFFGKYKADDINRCKFKCSEGNLEVPMSWGISSATTLKEQNLSSRFASLRLGKE
ncbi:probable helicase MAGATAMA 3 [Telopea speciosissima]|uniref:probable helicase MAGATAMA 3 n=1 Tax=Telopea speciosissima TaxID=54955 RepID=UPI001CC3E9C2|nr:probable helicase MAGATAMA 3 [Telopea speciosissima]